MTEEEMVPAKPPEPFASALAERYPYLNKDFRILRHEPKQANEDLI
jgi:hypothetical protein